jgi:hypothetical protein
LRLASALAQILRDFPDADEVASARSVLRPRQVAVKEQRDRTGATVAIVALPPGQAT